MYPSWWTGTYKQPTLNPRTSNAPVNSFDDYFPLADIPETISKLDRKTFLYVLFFIENWHRGKINIDMFIKKEIIFFLFQSK